MSHIFMFPLFLEETTFPLTSQNFSKTLSLEEVKGVGNLKSFEKEFGQLGRSRGQHRDGWRAVENSGPTCPEPAKPSILT